MSLQSVFGPSVRSPSNIRFSTSLRALRDLGLKRIEKTTGVRPAVNSGTMRWRWWICQVKQLHEVDLSPIFWMVFSGGLLLYLTRVIDLSRLSDPWRQQTVYRHEIQQTPIRRLSWVRINNSNRITSQDNEETKPLMADWFKTATSRELSFAM